KRYKRENQKGERLNEQMEFEISHSSEDAGGTELNPVKEKNECDTCTGYGVKRKRMRRAGEEPGQTYHHQKRRNKRIYFHSAESFDLASSLTYPYVLTCYPGIRHPASSNWPGKKAYFSALFYQR